MKNYRHVLELLTALVQLTGTAAHAAPFQNLDFESPVLPLVPINPPEPYVLFSSAFPGWQGFVGTNVEALAKYNNVGLATAGISIFDQNPIEGNYTAFLQAGSYLAHLEQILPATLSQTGDVPAEASLIQLKAWAAGVVGPPLWSVTLAGQPITMTPLETGPNYTLYSGDISAFSGQTVEFRISALYNEPYGEPGGFTALTFDSVTFVPEPGPVALSVVGLAVAGLVHRHRRSNRAKK